MLIFNLNTFCISGRRGSWYRTIAPRIVHVRAATDRTTWPFAANHRHPPPKVSKGCEYERFDFERSEFRSVTSFEALRFSKRYEFEHYEFRSCTSLSVASCEA